MVKEGNNFSEEWEVAYKQRTHQSKWPWSDLVSLVHRYVNTEKDDFSVLELGCGYGANIPFFLSLGAHYCAVEGSGFVVSHLKERFVELQETIKQADFTKDIPFEREFDLIIDRASITHNDTEAIQNTLRLITRRLKPEGVFIGVDWFSHKHSYCHQGMPTHDQYTRNQFATGPFSGIGNVHFSDELHLRELFSDFDFLALEHKKLEVFIPQKSEVIATWNFVARIKAE